MIITTKNLYSSGEHLTYKQIEVNNGVITEIIDYTGDTFDYENLAPAFVDIHINGGEVYHFTATPTIEALRDIETAGHKNGVGYLLPALITSSPENIFEAIEITRKYIVSNPGTSIMGLHLEGPFISEKKRGAHLTKYIRVPDDELLDQIIQKGAGVVKMITIAPEHFTNKQITKLVDSGIKVSLGHSNCTYKRAREAFDLGVNLVTHLYNAMSPLHHREPGLLGAALAAESVYTPIIPDGVHVDFEAVKIAMKMKEDKLFFISDALFQNHLKTEFKWEEFDAKLINGDYINADGNLAGATLSMRECTINGMELLGLSLRDSLNKSTTVPAKVLNYKAGEAEVGFPARFIIFNNNLKDLKYLNFQ